MQVTAGPPARTRNMDPNGALEIDTPNTAISLQGPGDYRVEVNDAGDATVVKVSAGTAEVTSGAQEYPVHPQQSATFTGTSNVSEDVASLGAPDEFDTWGFAQTGRQGRRRQPGAMCLRMSSARMISIRTAAGSRPPMTATCGHRPASRRTGRPINPGSMGTSPWKHLVDNASWGFAPFHYGRWGHFGGRWCWIPGPPRQRPVYAPALVAWLAGTQLRTSLAFGGGGGVAWFPLGPGEVYVPGYATSPGYIRNINMANTRVNDSYITQVYNASVPNVRYVNRTVPGAITAVSQTTFASGQPLRRSVVRLSADRRRYISARTPGPGKASVSVPAPRARLCVRCCIAEARGSRQRTPPRAPVPFLLEMDVIRTHGGRLLARSTCSPCRCSRHRQVVDRPFGRCGIAHRDESSGAAERAGRPANARRAGCSGTRTAGGIRASPEPATGGGFRA